MLTKEEIRRNRRLAKTEEGRMQIARESVARETERKELKKRQENRNEVKEYLVAIRAFRAAARVARVVAYRKFSPEAQRFTKRLHDDVRYLLRAVEEEFGA